MSRGRVARVGRPDRAGRRVWGSSWISYEPSGKRAGKLGPPLTARSIPQVRLKHPCRSLTVLASLYVRTARGTSRRERGCCLCDSQLSCRKPYAPFDENHMLGQWAPGSGTLTAFGTWRSTSSFGEGTLLSELWLPKMRRHETHTKLGRKEHRDCGNRPLGLHSFCDPLSTWPAKACRAVTSRFRPHKSGS